MGCLLPLGRSGCVGCAGCLLPILVGALCVLTPLDILWAHHHRPAAMRPSGGLSAVASRPAVSGIPVGNGRVSAPAR